jgi:hypothetical protein
MIDVKVKVYAKDKAPAFNQNRPGVAKVDVYPFTEDGDKIIKRCTDLFYGKPMADDAFYGRVNGPDKVPSGTVGILFTGGMDSTLLAVRALREEKHVLPIVNLFNCDCKQYNLLTAVVWHVLREKYGNRMLRPCFCLKNVQCDVVPQYFYGMFQQPINMFSLGYIPEPILENLSSIQAGFVKGDDAIPYIPEMRRLYKSVWKLSHAVKHPGQSSIPFTPLLFPLQDTEKADIRKELESYGDEHYTFSCENPRVDMIAWEDGYGIIRISECCRCHSCDRKEAYEHPAKVMDIGFRHDGSIVKKK